jgi:hypothetical protein
LKKIFKKYRHTDQQKFIMVLATFDFDISGRTVLDSWRSASTMSANHTLMYRELHVAGIRVKISVKMTNQRKVFVYYGVGLTELVTEVILTAKSGFVNHNDNMCCTTRFDQRYADSATTSWGRELKQFTTMASLERYIVDDKLKIRVEILDLVRKPDNFVLLERIYRATNAREQALQDAKLQEVISTNKKQEDMIQSLRSKVDSLTSQLENQRKRKTPEPTSQAAKSAKTDQADQSGACAAPCASKSARELDVSKLDDCQLVALQENILKEKRERMTCTICMDRTKCALFLPCGHRVTCKECSDRLMSSSSTAKCPICRAAIEKVTMIIP